MLFDVFRESGSDMQPRYQELRIPVLLFGLGENSRVRLAPELHPVALGGGLDSVSDCRWPSLPLISLA